MTKDFGFHSTDEQVASAFADRIKGRNVLVTGVSPNGLGSETVRVLAKYGASLIICASRTRSKVDEVIAAVQKETPSAQLRFLQLDLASLESCRKAGREVLGYSEPLHIVINNAAVMACPYATTSEGLELQFGANHIGHFVFTNTLLPKLIESAKAEPGYKPRIVNVSSLGHWASPIRFEDPNFEGGKAYEKWTAYGQSKTANILYSLGLASRLAPHGILAYSLHPGAIHTALGRDLDTEEKKAIGLLDKDGNPGKEFTSEAFGTFDFKTLQQGAATHFVAAFSPDIESRSGAYLVDAQLSKGDALKDYAADTGNADKLWELSEQLAGETFSF